MGGIRYLSLGLVFVATAAVAVDRRQSAGTLARAATPARLARLAEIAKDAAPPKVGESKRRGDYRKASTVATRIPFERVR